MLLAHSMEFPEFGTNVIQGCGVAVLIITDTKLRAGFC
jgi:hypothetical protein